MSPDLRPKNIWVPETTNGSRALVSFFFKKKLKNHLKVSKKIQIKILDVNNFEIYNPANFQLKILCILGYRKRQI
jgi:hypothetical protein